MKTATPLVLTVLALFLFFIVGNVGSEASGPGSISSGPGLPSSPLDLKSSGGNQESSGEIDQSALQQIQALLREKESRTAAQQKIDSQLLYAIKMRRGETVAPGVQTLAIDVGADDAGQVTVDITAIIDDQLLTELRGMNVEVSNVFPQYHSLRAIISLDQLETIASFAQIIFVQPKQEALYSQRPALTRSSSDTTHPYWDFNSRAARIGSEIQQALIAASPSAAPEKIGLVTSQGDTTHRAFTARGTFNTDGTGIKIGVLSDGVTSLATSQATGDLGPVTVLPGQAGFGNEGTAMLEIIHDLAPGAQLYFATAGNGLTSFAQNIRDLRSAGCDIILDDIGYFVESPFQDGQASTVISTNNAGVATQAVNDVVASGALYFSAAANSGNKNDGTAGTWEGDFVDGGTLSLVPGGKVHDFDPTAAAVQYDVITARAGLINLHWSDPLGASGNDYDVFVLNSTGTAVIASSTNIQSGTQDPYEQITGGAGITNNRIVILQKTGAANRFLHLGTNRGRLNFSTEGDTHGHNAASGAYGVAAVCAVCIFPSVFSSTDSVETFSSDGPRHIFFNGAGTAITPGNVSSTGGTILQKPDITAADGVAVSGAGGFPTLFYGTSAAAPHAAAIAALIKSANPALTQAEVRAALTSTAIDIEASGIDRDSGAGIVMPYLALQSLGPPVVGKAFLELSTVSKSETCCNGDGFIEPGESGTLSVTLNNAGLLTATSASATLTTSTPGVTVVNGTSAYPNMAASNGTGTNTTPFSLSLDSSLPHNPRVNFTLTINYSGGYQASQVFTFSIQFGIELITNGSFEAGDFSGWNVSTVATGGAGTPFQPWTVSRAGAGGFASFGISTTSPQDGTYDAWNGFDGAGPMEFRMYQDVSIPVGSSFTLFWRDRAQWNFCCGQTKARSYNVQLRNPATNAVLTTPYSFSTGTAGGYHDTGWQLHSSNLSAYTGQTVRIFFLETIPETFTGPAQIEFDSISVSNEPPQQTSGSGPAPPGLYGGTRLGQLFTVNLSTGAGTLVGQLPGVGSTEIEFNNTTRRAFTQFPDGVFQGQEFDISTGAGIGSAISDAGSFTGLEWVGSSLYGTMITAPQGASQLRILDPGTGFSTFIGPTGVNDPIAGLAYDGASGVMYGITGGASGGSSNFVTLNLSTGAATVVGSVGFNGGSLEFGPDGNLYAGSVGGTGNLYRIDKATGASTLVGATGFTNVTGLTLVTAAPPAPGVRLNAASYSVNEGTGGVIITVMRSGDTSGASAVNYATSDSAGLNNCNVLNTGVASPRCDYETTVGTLRFDAGETFKTIFIPIVNDSYAEGNESFTLSLSNVIGARLESPSTALVTIADNETIDGANPIDQTGFFVREHYLDFLNREPDQSGFDFWSGEIDNCAPKPQCIELKRINVSAAFFLSIEFQQTGYLVERIYKASFGDRTGTSTVGGTHQLLVPIIRLNEFLADTQQIGRGVVVLQPGWEQVLENNKQAFTLEFVQRSRFSAAFPPTLTPTQFVDKLFMNAGVTPSAADRNAAIAEFGSATNTIDLVARGRALRRVAENSTLAQQEVNRAFVLMQFFGYLRRNPDDPQDTDYTGYDFWLTKLNQFNGNFVNAEMVKAFINSIEYRQRFGP